MKYYTTPRIWKSYLKPPTQEKRTHLKLGTENNRKSSWHGIRAALIHQKIIHTFYITRKEIREL